MDAAHYIPNGLYKMSRTVNKYYVRWLSARMQSVRLTHRRPISAFQWKIPVIHEKYSNPVDFGWVFFSRREREKHSHVRWNYIVHVNITFQWVSATPNDRTRVGIYHRYSIAFTFSNEREQGVKMCLQKCRLKMWFSIDWVRLCFRNSNSRIE